ncbi:hypothetical protein SAMN02745857_03627 [Andreprevotia lacus DSM 23236]|jgi:hypothetical protein|uniref:Uncharacterized protein n=1 Tax=Andreprevotia lacus DSM 23236 TaxID=1121001 RepID=A0A1W1XYZ6_9NEIS|nr:hypothetical protein [Andreprevotia lacus]SMC29133.1 hypothetical protein SAMN02745857_03627 [Andreprevotia lacus DSM 23236]
MVEQDALHPRSAAAWQTLSFLAADAGLQLGHLGECSHDWHAGRAGRAPAHAFLHGMYLVYLYTYRMLEEECELPYGGLMQTLRDQLDWMDEEGLHGRQALWQPEAVSSHAAWQTLRQLAADVLVAAGLPMNFPATPLCVEDWVEPPIDPAWLEWL